MAPIILERMTCVDFLRNPPGPEKGYILDVIMLWKPFVHHSNIGRQAVRFHVASDLHHDNVKVACEYARRPNKAAPLFGQRLPPVIRYQHVVLFNHNPLNLIPTTTPSQLFISSLKPLRHALLTASL